MTETPTAAPGLSARLASRFFQTRWMVRMPIALYQAGLGSCLATAADAGTRRAQQRGTAARSARPADPGEYVIVSGFAERAPSGTATQRLTRASGISSGFGRNMPALAVPMTQTESAAVLEGYRQRHPAELEEMSRLFQQVCGRPIDTVPMVRLRMRPSP